MTVPMLQKDKHAEKECIMRKVECNWCQQVVVYDEMVEGHKWVNCPGRYKHAKALNQMIYLCRPVQEIADLINDGVHPTLKFTAEEEIEFRYWNLVL